ncbi:FtsX-like permease family protein [Rarobacter faecitabidus]|uniref:Putative ABC transport system permease protein n=1 Tax=Rarobacter faecitabidus TaxID=13243 RepID=A0A542ZU43_RARFA|nr:FtsX-like permease family protein [Rarobacter faecitabidus]TQL63862.1 putative ABC transport system permease protein [Rarobacter faecitabidus]
MFRLTLFQMRQSLARLIAAGIAIALGTGFVAATLLASNAMTRFTYDAVTAGYGDADVVATLQKPESQSLTWQDLDGIAATQGVAAATAAGPYYFSLSSGSNERSQGVVPATADRLAIYKIASGTEPSTATEIAIPANAAESLGVGIGDTVTWQGFGEYNEGTDESGSAGTPLTITAIVAPSGAAFLNDGDVGVMTRDGLAQLTSAPTPPVAIALDPGTTLDEASAALSASSSLPALALQTRDQAAKDTMAEFSDGQDVFTAFILAFAGLALIVAGLVISNTFQVLVAQRTRTLALLRCTGASKSQLRRSVLIEGGILGLASSLVGVVTAGGLVQLALIILRRIWPTVPIPAAISPTIWVVIVPVAVGIAVTVISCLVPARQATHVAPLAALRPIESPTVKRRGGLVRLIFAILLTVTGALLLIAGIAVSRSDVGVGLLAGVAGGALSFVGIVLGAVFWLPPAARLLAMIVGKMGPAARLAAANSIRNPRRIAATSTALLIGVTLVTTMSVGAASARATMKNTLDQAFPFDIAAAFYQETWSSGSSDGEFQSDAADFTTRVSENLERIRKVEGVRSAAPALSTEQVVRIDDSRELNLPAIAVNPGSAASEIIRGIDDAPTPRAGVAIISSEVAGSASSGNLRSGDRLRTGSAPAAPVLTVQVVPGHFQFILTDYADLEEARSLDDGSDTVNTLVVASLTDIDDAGNVLQDVQDVVTGSTWVQSPAAERAMFDKVINTVLAIIIGLLAVAVIIALIGVANTLSLSVLERRRENATLRAIGLSKKQLRGSLAVEGTFLAAVGAILGTLLGLAYGWIGSYIVLGSYSNPDLVVPWRDFGLVALVTLGAGLLASVVPARSALKASPVAALAVD